MKTNFTRSACALALAGAMLSVSATVSDAQAQTPPSVAPATKSPVQLSSVVKIERVEIDAAGKGQVVLRDPKDVVVVPGDRILFMLSVNNAGTEPAVGFRATNPMPAAVAFTSVAEEWADLSVDGGMNWGKLSTLTVKEKAADTGLEVVRPAVAQDVTHVRWIFADAIAPGVQRSISYRGVVK